MARLSRWYLVATLALAVGAPATLSFESDAVAAQKKRRGKKRRRAKAKRPTKAPPPPPPAPAPVSDVVPNTQFRGPTRIDFDDRLIQGQTNKSGAVYLFDRKETGISSMVKRRKSFRHLTIRTVYDR
ncbi:MAG: hypothetical protein RMA76_43515 [Deltaproteobacteria bacterium]|jgi:hypothetical protein